MTPILQQAGITRGISPSDGCSGSGLIWTLGIDSGAVSTVVLCQGMLTPAGRHQPSAFTSTSVTSGKACTSDRPELPKGLVIGCIQLCSFCCQPPQISISNSAARLTAQQHHHCSNAVHKYSKATNVCGAWTAHTAIARLKCENTYIQEKDDPSAGLGANHASETAFRPKLDQMQSAECDLWLEKSQTLRQVMTGCIQESLCSCLMVTLRRVWGSCHLRLRCAMLKKLSKSKATMPESPSNLQTQAGHKWLLVLQTRAA